MRKTVVRGIMGAAAMLLSSTAMAETYTPNAEFFAPRTFSFETTRGVTSAPTIWSAGVYQRSAGDGALGYFLYSDQSMAIHPSSTGPYSVILRFRAPRAGSYRFTGSISVVDQENGSGIGVSWTGSSRRVLDRGQAPASISTTIEMTAGQEFSIEIDPNGTAAYDTTGLALSVEGPDAPRLWTAGSWSEWSSTCGTATRTRTVTCVDGETGQKTSDASCQASTRPSASETSTQTSGCSYSWTPGSYGSPAPACGTTAMSRTVSCTRSDTQDADPSMCDPATKPATETATTDYGTCSYSWTADPWSAPSTACGEATQTRLVGCLRSDGTTVAESSCAQAGERPSTSQTTYQTSGCSFSWTTGEWSGAVPACGPTVENRSVTCVRSDGQPATDGSCPSGTRPADQRAATSYGTCGFSWEAGSWSAPSRTCGSATRTRDVVCRRSDGTQVVDAQCGSTRPDDSETVTDFSACSHTLSYGEWGATAPACGDSVQTRAATCIREDGATVDGALCPAPEPLTRQAADYSTCSFRWDVGSWSTPSACGQTTRTRAVTCLRSDGGQATDAQCDASGKPSSSEQVQDTSACQYSWVQTSVGEWSACVGGTQSRSVQAECRRSDGSVTSDALCSASGVRPKDESRGCTGPVTTPTQPGTGPVGGQVIFRRVIDVSR